MAFDSREYEWGDITVIFGGKDLTKIRGIKYSEKIEREAVYGKGRNPVAIQSGNISVEGEVTMLQSDYEALVQAGDGSVLSLSVDIETSYGNPADGNSMMTDRVVGARLTEAAKEFKQGDKFMEITLPFVALQVLNRI